MQWLLFAAASAAVFFVSCSQTRQASTTSPTEKKEPRYRSNFDFVAGKNLLWHESFATTPVGDFPKGWNTNAGAEVVEQAGRHSLVLTKDGVYIPTGVNLPKDFTLQFTLSCSSPYSYYSSPLQIMFAGLVTKKEFAVLKQYNPHNKNVLKITLHPMNAASNSGTSCVEVIEKGTKQSENAIGTKEFFAGGGSSTVKVSIWRQGRRLRVYLNQEKIWDLPQAFEETAVYNSLVFGISHLADKTGKLYLSDITLATDAPVAQIKGAK